jgi:hypothetical protein
MMPPKAEQIRTLLHGLPLADQLSMLLVAIVEVNPSAPEVALRMLAANREAVRASERLGPVQGFREIARLC